MATFEDLIVRTITRLSMVPGYGVQTYAEDQIAEMIYHKFISARDELWWDDLMAYATLTTDADGAPTQNVVRALPAIPVGDEIVIHKYSDIQYSWYENDSRPLAGVPRSVNPVTLSSHTRTGRKMMGPHEAKVVKWYGVRAGSQMTVRYRKYFPMFAQEDEVPFDEQLLILGAAWDYLEDDGSNPQQIEKFRNLYIKRFDQLARSENNESIPIGEL